MNISPVAVSEVLLLCGITGKREQFTPCNMLGKSYTYIKYLAEFIILISFKGFQVWKPCYCHLNHVGHMYLSRTGFPIQLKSQEVEINHEKMSQMIIKEKLSERAVMKENGL